MNQRTQRFVISLIAVLAIAATACVLWPRTPHGAHRPQNPALPLPYQVHEVSFGNTPVIPRLSGTLTIPATPGPHPAIVLIPGSGEVLRDGAMFGHRFYLVLADALTRRGFVVLRSDKRGLGRSGGDFATATTHDFAADIGAATAFLRKRPDIDGRRIGLVGHSEGALVGAMVAAKNPGIAFLVLMAGNGIPAGDMLLARTRHAAGADAAGDATRRELALQRAVIAAATVPATAQERETKVRKLYQDARAQYGRPYSEDDIAPFLSPWMRTLLAINPQAWLQQIRCPVLALVGDKDRVVPAPENLPALKKALAANPAAEVRLIPGVNHFFQTARSGEFAEMATIEETMSPQVMELIGAWAANQLSAKESRGETPFRAH
ncbi:alpha/beta hydrolase family protein [Massilia sp. TN1-12]|uniref:alpha/beta hydrolase family protein n=1 Tax=Massilia paldalensis TaxID=3377675 RepID=UPI00384E9E22